MQDSEIFRSFWANKVCIVYISWVEKDDFIIFDSLENTNKRLFLKWDELILFLIV